jgi:hypothetical protein
MSSTMSEFDLPVEGAGNMADAAAAGVVHPMSPGAMSPPPLQILQVTHSHAPGFHAGHVLAPGGYQQPPRRSPIHSPRHTHVHPHPQALAATVAPTAAPTTAPTAAREGKKSKSKRRARARAKEGSDSKRKEPAEAMPFLRGDSCGTEDEAGTEEDVAKGHAEEQEDGSESPLMLSSPIRQRQHHSHGYSNGYMDDEGGDDSAHAADNGLSSPGGLSPPSDLSSHGGISSHGGRRSVNITRVGPLNRGGSEHSGLGFGNERASSRNKLSRHSVSTVPIGMTRRRSISDSVAGAGRGYGEGSMSASVANRRLPRPGYRRAPSASLAEAQALHEEQLREQRAQERTPRRQPRSLRHSSSTGSTISISRATTPATESSSPVRRARRRPDSRA